MKYVLNKCTYKGKRLLKPCIKFNNNILTEVNVEFEELTGYSKQEVLGRSSEEIDEILKIDSQIHLKNIEDEFIVYLFTKNFEAREVIIKCNSNLREYMYTVKEIRNSRVEDRLSIISSILQDDAISIAIYDKNGISLMFNTKYLSCLSKIEDLDNIKRKYLGKRINDVFNEYKIDEYEAINFTSLNKPLHMNEVQYKLNDKNCVYFDTSFIPLNINGEVKYIIHRLMDVTTRVLERKEIEQQKRELELVIENIPHELIIFNKEGQYLRLNKAARESEMFDYVKANSSKGFQKQAVTYEMDVSKISFENMPINEVIRGNKVNKRIIRKNKKTNKTMYCDITGNPIYDDEGNFIAGILLMRNIDERIKEEESLYKRFQYESLYKVVENLNLGYTSVSYPGFKVKYLNKKSFEYLQNIKGVKSLTSALGKNMFTIFNYSTYEMEEIKSSLKDTIKYNKGVYANIIKANMHGEVVFRKVIYHPIYNLNKKVDQIIAISFDVTDEIKSKIELEEALKVQDEIYANIAHELKTPLNVIYSANQMQEFYTRNFNLEEIKDKLNDYNSSIKQNCLRLTKLINNIVDISKIKTGHLKVDLVNENIIDIVENIVISVSEYIKSAGLKIIFDTNTDEKIIACDPDKIERIILNLISNAIKFSNVNGEIIVSILDNKDKIEIYVKDTGLGIEKKNLDSIFERFYQVDKSLSRNAEGSGIGLSLVKSLVDLHGGNISVKSEVGKGSEFKIELPNVIVENSNEKSRYNCSNSKIEMLNIEFSDIYSI